MSLNKVKKRSKLSNLFIVLFTIYMATIISFSSSVEMIKYSQLAFIAAFGVCVIFLLHEKCKFVLGTYMLIFLAFILFCAFSIMWSKNAPVALTRTLTLVQLWLMSLVLISYLTYECNIEATIWAIFFSGVIGSLYIFGYYGVDEYLEMLEAGERAGSEIANVNTVGMYMAITTIIGFFLGYEKKKIYCYILLLPAVVLALGSGSRKALAMMVIGIILIVLFNYINNANWKKALKAILIMIALTIVFFMVKDMPIFETVFDRFDSMTGEKGPVDGSTRIRMKMIEEGWKYFKQHPLSGTGIANSFIVSVKIPGAGSTYLHNNFIELLATVGIFGFVFYYSMVMFIIYNLFAIVKKTKSSVCALISIILLIQVIMDYGSVSYFDKMTYIYFTIGAAVVQINKKIL